MNVTKVNVLHNPTKVVTVQGKYTNSNNVIRAELCLENANISNGTWDLGINCVKAHSENITKTNIMNSVNLSANVITGYQHTKIGVQCYNPTIGSFFLKIRGSSLNQRHAFYDLSPIKWFTITTPSNFIEIAIDFWPKYTLIKQLRATRDSEDFAIEFQIDIHLIRLQ